MLTLADLVVAPDLMTQFKYGATITLACSHPPCDVTVEKQRGRVRKMLKAGQTTTYCSQRCRGRHTLLLATEVRDGIEGRICSDCQEWVPKTQMTAAGRAKVCRHCRRNQPRNKFSIMKSQAKHRGHTWTLTRGEFMTFWGQPCSYCNEDIETVGLDRVDPSKGYEAGNVVSCCHPCNRGKGDGTVEDFKARCQGVSSRYRRVM